MAIIAGIDEAGYGPLLGPLVVSAVAFRVPDAPSDRCLWNNLRESCTSTATRKDRRLVVADSKTVYRGGDGLATLERTVLVTLAWLGHRPRTWRELLQVVSPTTVEQLDGYPWYAGVDCPLPLRAETGDVPTHANALRRDASNRDVAMAIAACEVLPAGQFNDLVKKTRNKATVSFGLVLRLLDRLLRATPDGMIRVFVDRQGGRMRYREALMTGLPGFDLQILEESEPRSAYRLTNASRTIEIEFTTEGERRNFCVALASMFSKYLRELDMHVFNRFWSSRLSGLRPTAGYYTDARRWLRDVGEELDRQGVDRRLLLRVR